MDRWKHCERLLLLAGALVGCYGFLDAGLGLIALIGAAFTGAAGMVFFLCWEQERATALHSDECARKLRSGAPLVLFLAIALTACSPLSRYNVEMRPPAPDLNAQVDHAIEALDVALWAADLMEQGATRDLLATKFVTLKWGDENEEHHGTERVVYAKRTVCLANTYFTHRLVHLVLAHKRRTERVAFGQVMVILDPDSEHTEQLWWQAAEMAQQLARVRAPECDLDT